MPERTADVAGAAARAWGGSLRQLDDWTVLFVARPMDACGGQAAPMGYRGCTGGEVIRVALDGAPCPEATVLAHEVGRVIIGDSAHLDGRWCDAEFWERMADALLAADPGAEPECVATMRVPWWLYYLSRGRCP